MFRGIAIGSLMAALAVAAAGADQSSAKPALQPPAKPDCTVSDVRQSATPPAPSTLPIETRRAIFVELQDVLARVQRDAAKTYPTAEGGAMMSPTNVQKDAKLSRKRDTAARSLERTYLADVLKARSLTCTAARDIMREGKDLRWPVSQTKK